MQETLYIRMVCKNRQFFEKAQKKLNKAKKQLSFKNLLQHLS